MSIIIFPWPLGIYVAGEDEEWVSELLYLVSRSC